MLEALDAHCGALERDPSVRAVVLTAEGDRAFCTGADITAWSELAPADFARHWVREGHRIFDRLARLSKPTVAAISGHAFGGGLELAAACDIRIMAPKATLALPEAGVGIVPGWSGTQRLVRLLPEPVIREMALFGRRISAERALGLGFVAEVSEDARQTAHEVAERAAALSPRAVEVAKYMIQAGVGEDRSALIEALGSGMIAASEDRVGGRRRLPRQAQTRVSGEVDVTIQDFTLIAAADPSVLPAEPFAARHLIDGVWRDSADGATFERHSPAHGTLVTRAAKGGAADTEAAIAAARRAFDDGRWSRRSGKDRAALLLQVADLIDRDRERIARTETLEAGKPISQARGEIEGAADLWRYAAALARTLHGDSHNSLGSDMLAVVLKEPIGVASIITPWNFPFLIVSQKLPFALAAGCTAVVKPSELTPSTTVILGELLIEAGLPAGVVNIVLGYGQPVGALMTTDPRVDMVTFTGSTGVGKAIVAAAAPTLKKVSLELGGKNPQVVFPDADLDAAVDAIVFGIYFNAGECCNSGSRIIVHEAIAEAVTERVVALSRKVALRRAARSGDQNRRHRLARAPGEDRRLRPRRRRGGRVGSAGRSGARGPGSFRPVLRSDRGHRRHRRHGDRPRGGVRTGIVGADLSDPRRGGASGEQRRIWPIGRGLERERPHLP